MIEEYIEFAIDNGLTSNYLELTKGEDATHYFQILSYDDFRMKVYSVDRFGEEITEDEFDIIRLITSKRFIEAVSTGLFGKEEEIKVFMMGTRYSYYEEDKWELQEDIARETGLAIYNNKLEEFITNLLPSEQTRKDG